MLYIKEKPKDWNDTLKILLQHGKTILQRVKTLEKEQGSLCWSPMSAVLAKIHRDATYMLNSIVRSVLCHVR